MTSQIDKLIYLLSKVPGVGPRSAKRAVLHLLKYRDQLMFPLAEELSKSAQIIKNCQICGNIDEKSPCTICSDSKRNQKSICVVESISDLWAIERGHIFNGTFHVLGGTLSASQGVTPDDLSLANLAARIKTDQVQEVIIATNATLDGQTTAFYITDFLSKETKVHVTRLAYGIPVGGELDYLDDSTLEAALLSRKSF
ncbi:MAG: recombination mediator RecR [Rickettsiales bacterium]|jgi:recombination protein RecR|nr:recombination mediator RecR [Rickettsiales bacterium]